ncbi:MAG TPA: hypothetical protein VE954_40995 [Oligoflexus sp.]|uniref:hypothetical protein n=1 Tax=Oligoflexus sp. TaxID=1971216 RepID=UPI002D4F0A61|nr:hypothetical protein [Oligoflexus sp.]HYX39519.1 hypothetical protein [Oligoflexus sp.]
MRKQLGSVALLASSFFFLTGMGVKHSEVKAQSSVKGKTVELAFKIKLLNEEKKSEKDYVQISREGPWTLELINTKGLKLETKEGKFTTLTFDDSLPGFKVKAELDGAAPAGKVDYMVRAFVCTTDKKTCYTERHKGSLDWKTN